MKLGQKGWDRKTNRGHTWKSNEYGLDTFAFTLRYCNGPECINCGYTFCLHCENEPEIECPKGAR